MDEKAIIGCILGTAVGDALGLPYEGIHPGRAKRLLGAPDRYRFFFGRGMISDDTEHTCMVAQSLIESDGEVDLFTRRLAKRLRWWILALPAGVGKATALSCIKLWLGAKPNKSGMRSAGNGPAMRAAIIGASIDDIPRLLCFVRAPSQITHSDRKAEYGAIAVTLAVHATKRCTNVDSGRWLDTVADSASDDGAELVELLRRAIESVDAGHSTMHFARSLTGTRSDRLYLPHRPSLHSRMAFISYELSTSRDNGHRMRRGCGYDRCHGWWHRRVKSWKGRNS